MWRDALKSKADTLCFQETHLTPDVSRLKNKIFPRIFYSSSSIKKAGMAILIQVSVSLKLINNIPDPKGRFAILKL